MKIKQGFGAAVNFHAGLAMSGKSVFQTESEAREMAAYKALVKFNTDGKILSLFSRSFIENLNFTETVRYHFCGCPRQRHPLLWVKRYRFEVLFGLSTFSCI